MANKKETFFERLARKNKDDKPVTLKSKKTRIAIYSVLGVLGVAIAAGVAIPIAIQETKVNTLNPMKDNEVLGKFGDTDITVGNFNDYVTNVNDVKLNKLERFITKETIYKLYKEEQLNSMKFQYLINLSKKPGTPNNYNIALKSFDEIKEEASGKIHDLEHQYKTSFKSTEWQKMFSEELNKRYSVNNVDDAIDTLVLQQVTKDALRKYTLADSTTYSVEDWNRVAPRKITELVLKDGEIKEDPNGKTIYAAGDSILKDKLLVEVTSSPSNSQNTVVKYKKTGSLTEKKVESIRVLLNNSFSLDPSERNVSSILDSFTKNKLSFMVDKAVLAIKPNLDNASNDWSLSKETLTTWLSHAAIERLDETNALLDVDKDGNIVPKGGKTVFEHTTWSSFMNNFAKISNHDEKDSKDINTILKKYLLITVPGIQGENGNVGVKEATSMASNWNIEEFLTILNKDLKVTDETSTPDVKTSAFYTAFVNVQKLVVDKMIAENSDLYQKYLSIKTEYEANNATLGAVVEAYNASLKNTISLMTDAEINKTIAGEFKNVFLNSTKDKFNLYSSFKVGDKTVYVVPTKDGITLLSSKAHPNTVEDVYKAMLFDLQNVMDEKPQVYNYNSIVKEWTKKENDLIVSKLIEENSAELLKKDNPEEIGKKTTQKDIDTITSRLINKSNSLKVDAQLDFIKKLTEFIEKHASKNQFVNISVSDDATKLVFKDHAGNILNEDANTFILNLAFKALKGGK